MDDFILHNVCGHPSSEQGDELRVHSRSCCLQADRRDRLRRDGHLRAVALKFSRRPRLEHLPVGGSPGDDGVSELRPRRPASSRGKRTGQLIDRHPSRHRICASSNLKPRRCVALLLPLVSDSGSSSTAVFDGRVCWSGGQGAGRIAQECQCQVELCQLSRAKTPTSISRTISV